MLERQAKNILLGIYSVKRLRGGAQKAQIIPNSDQEKRTKITRIQRKCSRIIVLFPR